VHGGFVRTGSSPVVARHHVPALSSCAVLKETDDSQQNLWSGRESKPLVFKYISVDSPFLLVSSLKVYWCICTAFV
jgi:hypothetical protein